MEEREDRQDAERAEAAAEAWANRCAMAAPAYHEAMELQRAAQQVHEAKLARQAEQERQQRIADAEEHVAMLLGTGHRRRTMSEVLASMAGWG